MVNVQGLWRIFVFSDLIWSYFSLIYFGYYGFDVTIVKGEVGESLFRKQIVARSFIKYVNEARFCQVSGVFLCRFIANHGQSIYGPRRHL